MMMIERGPPEGPVVGLTARFRAPRAKVFDSWTRPELIERWFFVEPGFRTHDVETKLEPLGAYQIVITSTDGSDPTRIHGHFVEVAPGESLTYTWTGACANEQYWTLVSVRFEDDPDGSRIVLDHGVFREDADRAMHEQGWLACLATLERLVDG